MRKVIAMFCAALLAPLIIGIPIVLGEGSLKSLTTIVIFGFFLAGPAVAIILGLIHARQSREGLQSARSYIISGMVVGSVIAAPAIVIAGLELSPKLALVSIGFVAYFALWGGILTAVFWRIAVSPSRGNESA